MIVEAMLLLTLQSTPTERAIERRAPSLEGGARKRLAAAVEKEAKAAHFDPLFVLAVVEEESFYDPKAVSPTGAKGLMQIVPSTFKRMGGRGSSFNVEENVHVGVEYLRRLRRAFGSRDLYLIAYSAGPKPVLDHWYGIKTLDESLYFYPKEVKERYRKIRRAAAVTELASR